MSAAVELKGVSVTLGGNEVVREISATVERGEWVALIGPNGAGKTTMLRALAGLVSFAGSILLEGRAVRTSTRREIAREVALVPQVPQTPPELTVAEYVLLGRTPHIGYLATESRSDRLAAERAIARLTLRPFSERPLGSLSGGERQRVVLARALAQEAPILLLDRGRVVAQGSAQDVLSETSIAAYYGANVRVIHENGSVFVLPRRAEHP